MKKSLTKNERNFAKSSTFEISEIMRNFAKRLNETDRNVLRNFGDSEISVQTLVSCKNLLTATQKESSTLFISLILTCLNITNTHKKGSLRLLECKEKEHCRGAVLKIIYFFFLKLYTFSAISLNPR